MRWNGIIELMIPPFVLYALAFATTALPGFIVPLRLTCGLLNSWLVAFKSTAWQVYQPWACHKMGGRGSIP